LRFLDRTDERFSLVEKQSRMFRNSDEPGDSACCAPVHDTFIVSVGGLVATTSQFGGLHKVNDAGTWINGIAS